MKIAVIQMMYPKGHRRLDEAFVRLLSCEHQLIIVDEGKYFPSSLYENPNIKHICAFQPYINRWEPLKRMLRRINLLIVLLKLRHLEYDRILFLNCHNALYKVANWLPPKKCLIIHHYDIDALFNNKKDYIQFNKVKERFNHAFLADYISEKFLKQTQIEKKYVYTIHQPLVFRDEITKVIKEDIMVGIGHSTDEKFIKEVVKKDKESNGKLLHNKMILRSKISEYHGTNVDVIKGFLPREEYEGLYRRAKVSVVNYPSSYVYRYSGIMDDSLAMGLVVYCNDTMCGQYFARKYPNSVKVFNSVNDLWRLLDEPLPAQPKEESELFSKNHSDDFILSQINAAF